MNQQNTQPLYKVLNEKRQQGFVKRDGERVTNETTTICRMNSFINESEVTAEYIALATNNLANVADALQALINNPMPSAKACGFNTRMENYFKAVE